VPTLEGVKGGLIPKTPAALSMALARSRQKPLETEKEGLGTLRASVIRDENSFILRE
jgi:hypothetical protein